MNDAAILKELQSIRADINRLLGIRLDQEAMASRLGVTKRTLYNRIQSGTVPRPGTDGKWLLSSVMEWENNQNKELA